MVTKKPRAAQLEGKLVRLVWASADELPALYSNQLLITHGGQSEFHIVFGHLTPPLVLAGAEVPDYFTIKPIVKIVVTPETLRKMLDAMSKNLEAFDTEVKENEHVE